MILNFSNTVDGALTDVTSVKLSDPTGAFGLRRTDTNAVIVADGTDFDHDPDETGLYSYTFTEPAAGLTYEYWVEVVYDGETYREQRFTEGSAAVSNDAYLAAAEVRSLGATLPGLTTLLAKTDDELGMLAFLASIDIDTAMRYQGRKYDLGDGSVSGTVGVPQSREFPRVVDADMVGQQFGYNGNYIGPAWFQWAGGMVQDWDPAANGGTGGPVVPKLVKIAVIYQMAWLVNPANSERVAAILGGLAGQSTASLSETYRSAAELAALAGGGRLDPRAAGIMDKNYRLRSGRML